MSHFVSWKYGSDLVSRLAACHFWTVWRMTQKISCVDGIAVGNFENIGGSEVVEGNLQHKPLFWFRSNTKTKTQNQLCCQKSKIFRIFLYIYSFSKLKFPQKWESMSKNIWRKKLIQLWYRNWLQKPGFGFILLQSLNFLMDDWPHQPYINGSDGPGRWLRSVTGWNTFYANLCRLTYNPLYCKWHPCGLSINDKEILNLR